MLSESDIMTNITIIIIIIIIIIELVVQLSVDECRICKQRGMLLRNMFKVISDFCKS